MISPRGKKFLRFVVIAAGIVLILSIIVNWWFQRNAIYLIKAIVERESHGQYKIDIGRLKIHYFHPPRVELFDTQLHVYDSTGKNLMYVIGVNHLALQGKSLRNLVFGKKLLVDYIVVEAPGVNIHTQNFGSDNSRSGSISHQIGNITLFLQKLAKTMEVKSLKITNGALGLHNLKPYNKSVQLSNLNFLVNNFHSDSASRQESDTQFLFSDNIELEAGKQNIEFPDNRHTLRFSSLEISTQNKNIDIFDASLTGRSTDTTLGAFKVDIRRLHLINTDFNTLYQYDRIKVDSIYCHDPKVDLFIDASSKKDSVATDSTTEVMIKSLVGDMDIKYVGFLNSTISVTAKNRTGTTRYTTKEANLEFFGVKIKTDEYQASLVDRVNLSIRNYRASSADSLYDIYLDSVTMTEKNLYLKNFRLMPSDRNTLHTRRTMIVPTLELRNISFYNLIFYKKLTATELILTDPSFTDYFATKQVSQNNSQQSFGQILMAISKHAQVNQLIIVNGNLLSQSVSSQDRKVEVTGMYTAVDTRLLTSDTSFENLQTSLSNVVFQRALLTFPKAQFELTEGIFIGKDKILTAKTIRGATDDNNFILSADNVRIHGFFIQKSFEKAHIDSVQWTNATIQFHQRNKSQKKEGPKAIDLTVRYLSLQNTKLDLDLQGGLVVKTDLQNLSFQKFNISPERKFVLSDLALDGKFLQLHKPGLMVQAGDFSVHENQRSYINNLDFDIDRKTELVKGRIPRMEMQFQLNELLSKGNLLVSRLDMKKPEISIQINDGERPVTPEKRTTRRIIDINELNIEEAKIDFLSEKNEQKTAFSSPDASIFLKGLSSGTTRQAFVLNQFDIKLTGYNINDRDSMRLYSEKGKILLSGSDVSKGTKQDPKSFTAHIAVAEVNDANTEFARKQSDKPIKFENISAGVRNLNIDTLENRHIGQRLKANPSLFIKNINIIQKDEKNDMAVFGLQYNNGGHVLSLDSFRYKPAVDRETFNRGIPHEKDYIQTKTGKITLSGIDIEKLIADSSFSASKIEIDSPWLSIYKDKHNPFDSSKYKPLPTNLLKKIRFGVEVDSLRLNGAMIEYMEWNEKTHKEAGFDFSHVNALITNIRNRNARETDSMELIVSALWMDSIGVKVDFTESYTDSLSGFMMAAAMGPFDARKLNRFLPTIVSAEIISGKVDTMRMNALGREYVALGYMQLLYHDAKVRFLEKGNPVKKTFKTRIVTFFANTIIRKKNEDRVGKIYAERVLYRGIFNYWLRIVMAGVSTNTGVKSNAHQAKKYQKDLKKLNLPPVSDVNF